MFRTSRFARFILADAFFTALLWFALRQETMGTHFSAQPTIEGTVLVGGCMAAFAVAFLFESVHTMAVCAAFLVTALIVFNMPILPDAAALIFSVVLAPLWLGAGHLIRHIDSWEVCHEHELRCPNQSCGSEKDFEVSFDGTIALHPDGSWDVRNPFDGLTDNSECACQECLEAGTVAEFRKAYHAAHGESGGGA